jgi:nucleotide-binding universal stress UspA family protein
VAAIDFSVASIRAAQVALLVMGDCGTLMLVHVRPAHDLSSAQHTVRSAATNDVIAARFKRLRAELAEHAPAGAVIETQMESGGIVHQVLSVAREVGADMIAVGMHSPRARTLTIDLGTAASLLRRAPCSVLASPVSRVARIFGGGTGSRYWATAPEWLDSTSPV